MADKCEGHTEAPPLDGTREMVDRHGFKLELNGGSARGGDGQARGHAEAP